MFFGLTPATLVGLLAVLITVIALLRRTNRGLLLLLGFGVSLWTLHYWLLGTIPGTVIHGIGAVSIFGAHAMRHMAYGARFGVGVAFSALGVSSAIVFGTGIADVVAAVGCIIMTMSQYIGRGIPLRVGFLTGEVLFFVFAALVGSVPGMMVTTSNFIAGAVGIRRMLAHPADFTAANDQVLSSGRSPK